MSGIDTNTDHLLIDSTKNLAKPLNNIESCKEHEYDLREAGEMNGEGSRDNQSKRPRSITQPFLRVGRFVTRTWKCPNPIVILIGVVLVLQSVREGIYTLQSLSDLQTTMKTNISWPQSPKSYKPFNSTNPHETSWCPNAICHNSPLCSPCNRRFLFLVATGRSGSTTLLSMFNHLPNLRLSGENHDELYVASRLESNLRNQDSHRVLEQHWDKKYGAWRHNGIPEQAIAFPIQDIFYTLNPPPAKVLHRVHLPGEPSIFQYDRDKILGFKTIRLNAENTWNPKQAADFLKDNFPCSRVIVNIRSDIQSQVQSKMNLGWDMDTERQVTQNKFLREFSAHLGEEMAQLIDMNEWTNDISILNSLLEWLGFIDCHFQEILHENHYRFEVDTETQIHLGDQCRYPQ